MASQLKAERYEIARRQIHELVRDLDDSTAAMATVAAVLYDTLDDVSWVGFYRVVKSGLLRVGPYQGPVGCLEIPFDQGVCGTAARDQTAQIVPDVHAFPGHIACDPRSLSEIVVPVFNTRGRLVAVLDLDSHKHDAFDQEDADHLEAIAALLTPSFDARHPTV